MIEKGYCQCGCGGKTAVIIHTVTKTGRFKGQYNKFISGHNGRAKPGKRIGRSTHYKMAENALGKPLPQGTILHHFPDLKNFETLVLCQDDTYHKLLHRRQKALKECGHANWYKCNFCKKYGPEGEVRVYPCGPKHHAKCSIIKLRERRRVQQFKSPILSISLRLD